MPSDMSARRPAALRRGPATKPRSNAVARRASRPATANSASTPGCARPARIRAKPLLDEDPVRLVEPHDVGDGAERDQVEQLGEVRLGARRERAVGAQSRARREQHVEHHAHARDVLARERAARLVRIDDDRGRRQRRARQVMVGDQHVDAARGRRRDAVDARDAVVDGDEQARLHLRGERDDLRRQAVAELEPVGHDEVDVGAHRAQARARRPRTPWRRRRRSRRR